MGSRASKVLTASGAVEDQLRSAVNNGNSGNNSSNSNNSNDSNNSSTSSDNSNNSNLRFRVRG